MTSSTRLSNRISTAVFTTPALVLYSVFVVIPTIAVIALSFFDWNFFGSPVFVGFDNFSRALGDAGLAHASAVSAGYLLFGIVPTIVVGFLLAVLVNVAAPVIGVLRVLYFVPVVVSVAVSGVLWSFLYDPRQGPVASLFRMLGLAPIDFLGTTGTALPAVTLVMIWAGLPIVMVFYLSALQRISPDIYAAASLDGAGAWRMLWSITWPNVAPTTALLAVLQVANFSAASLDYSLVLTRGGPLDATTSLGLYAYQVAFERQEVGYASVISLVQVALILMLLVIGHRISKAVSR